MLAGNNHQVHRAGVLQNPPISHRQPRAVPQHQRGQRPFPAMGFYAKHALTHTVAPGTDATGGIQALAAFHRTSGTDVLPQQPGLVIERLRIDQAAQALQPHRQPPGFAGPQFRTAIPGQTQPRG
ncbi:hypothetical protein D9M68_756870 [compost metagenome]